MGKAHEKYLNSDQVYGLGKRISFEHFTQKKKNERVKKQIINRKNNIKRKQ